MAGITHDFWQRCVSPLRDRRLLISMLRNALPPTAALWVIESSKLGKSFDTVGYLPIILCILQQPIQPRVQFLRGMLVTCILTSLSACIALLAGYCSTQARLHTTPAGQDLDEYNSSAAAVSGIWLLFAVWAIQSFRVYHPQYTTSCVISTIMAIVSIGISANLSTTTATTNFVAEMLQMFALAFAFSTAVNLLILPTTSRDVVFADIKQYISLLGKILSSEASYIQTLEQIYSRNCTEKASRSAEKDGPPLRSDPQSLPGSSNKEADNLSSLTASISKLHTKLRGDISFAKNDVGWSNINSSDFDILAEHFRKLILSLRGMSALMPHFQTLCEERTQNSQGRMESDATKAGKCQKSLFSTKNEEEIVEWRMIFSDLKEPTGNVEALVRKGLQYVKQTLGLDEDTSMIATICCGWVPERHGARDVEIGTTEKSENPTFLQSFENEVGTFHRHKGQTFQKWLVQSNVEGADLNNERDGQHKHTMPGRYLSSSQEQLFVILFMQHLYHHITDIILDLVRFANSKDPRISPQRKHLIIPDFLHSKSLVHYFSHTEDTHEDFDDGTTQNNIADLTDKVVGRPAITWRTTLGFTIARASRVVGSQQSLFGFRVACAVMSVVIIGLLGQTQQWFFNHRGLWAAVFIPFSMSPNSGETLSILAFRMIGSTWALGLAIVNWYIVDGHPAGVIVFYFVFTFFEQYLVIKFPQYGGVWRPAMITRAIITGYTLQTQHSHIPTPPATTVDEYPIYLIGPYRYACTAIGVFIAFIWTVFPRAVSARSLTRKKLGEALALLALYYNCMHSTVGMWAVGAQGDMEDTTAPGRRLRLTRDKLFAQELVALEAIRGHVRFSRFEPSMGDTFQRELYSKITNEVDTVVSYMNMIVYASGSLEHASGSKNASYWQEHFAKAFREADFSTHNISVMLSVLSSAVSNNESLPPGLVAPQPYHLTRHIAMKDPEMLTTAHAEDPGYAAFAVIEIGSSMMYESLGRLLHLVRELVGVTEYFSMEKEVNGKQV